MSKGPWKSPRRCRVCGHTGPIEDFPLVRSKGRKDCHKTKICIPCDREKNRRDCRRWRNANCAEQNEKAKLRMRIKRKDPAFLQRCRDEYAQRKIAKDAQAAQS